VVNKYAKDKKLLKDKDPNLTGDDIREGLARDLGEVSEPPVRGQTKTSWVTPRSSRSCKNL